MPKKNEQKILRFKWAPGRWVLQWDDARLSPVLHEAFPQVKDEDGNRVMCKVQLVRKPRRETWWAQLMICLPKDEKAKDWSEDIQQSKLYVQYRSVLFNCEEKNWTKETETVIDRLEKVIQREGLAGLLAQNDFYWKQEHEVMDDGDLEDLPD